MNIQLWVELDQISLITAQGLRELKVSINRQRDGSIDSESFMAAIRNLERMVKPEVVD